jgi:DNA-binding LacI/PurR family transcriptional regulator
MSKIIEYINSAVVLISSSILALASVFIIGGFFFLALGFFNLDGFKMVSRESTNFPPVLVGAVISSVGLLLFVRNYSPTTNKNVYTIVFYSPTIKSNSFFMELFDYLIERSKQKGYNFVIEKGDLEEFHRATNYLDIIRRYSGNQASNTVLIMIPPSPAAYKDIWKLPEDLKVNLITLDMDIEGQESQFYGCPFHKKVILVDNRYGAMLSAKEIVSYCKTENIKEFNVIICEGSFHARGQMFKAELEKLVQESDLEANYLGPFEQLSFSNAVTKAREYTHHVLGNATEELKEKSTFIFCANDNLAIGAWMEVSRIYQSGKGSFKPIRIICFDASTFVKMHMELGDRFFWRAVDQGYTEIVKQAIETAEILFEGQVLSKEPTRIQPTIHKRYNA